MKVGRDYTWWVAYSWTYEYYDSDDKKWYQTNDFESGRFACRKKDIKKEVMACIHDELEHEQYRNLKVKIDDYYMTTPEEI